MAVAGPAVLRSFSGFQMQLGETEYEPPWCDHKAMRRRLAPPRCGVSHVFGCNWGELEYEPSWCDHSVKTRWLAPSCCGASNGFRSSWGYAEYEPSGAMLNTNPLGLSRGQDGASLQRFRHESLRVSVPTSLGDAECELFGAMLNTNPLG